MNCERGWRQEDDRTEYVTEGLGMEDGSRDGMGDEVEVRIEVRMRVEVE